jgi:hypothetical protein
LLAVKASLRALASVAHLGVDTRHDPVGPRAVMQPRDPASSTSKSWSINYPQQTRGVRDARVAEHPSGLLDGPQGAFGVLRDAGQPPLALGALTPAAVRLLSWARVVELQAALQHAGGTGSASTTASSSRRTPWRTSRTVSWVAAAPSIGVESTICSTDPRRGASRNARETGAPRPLKQVDADRATDGPQRELTRGGARPLDNRS